MVALQVHVWRDVFVDDRFEALRRGVLVLVRFDEVLHHRNEFFIASTRVPHNLP